MEKREILEAAFNQWQHNMFIHTSLTPVAEELKVTKAAIYRHFSSKKSLEQAMEELFASDYRLASPTILSFPEKVKGENSRKGDSEISSLFLEEYTRGLTDFLSAHPGYIRFMTARLFHSDSVDKLLFKETFFHEAEQIIHWFRTSGMEESLAIRTIRYFYTHLLGFSLLLLKNGKKESEIPGYAGVITSSFLQGFSASADTRPDFTAAEVEISVKPEDLPRNNRIIDSLLAVVSRDGLKNASLSKIADEAGYSKSTLYSFFKNKDEMLFSLFSEHAAAFDTLYRRFCGREYSFQERVYRLIVLLHRYLVRNESFLITLHWMRFQNLHIETSNRNRWKESLPEFFSLPEERGCRNFGLKPASLMNLLWVQMIREILELTRAGNLVEVKDGDNSEQLRNLYRIFCHGAEDFFRS